MDKVESMMERARKQVLKQDRRDAWNRGDIDEVLRITDRIADPRREA